ncbi:MAG: hypothetical protein IPH16_09790 [Haliscomenobacter sp.]|nr:hypothetical protein [Haliscomenobacter sp.]
MDSIPKGLKNMHVGMPTLISKALKSLGDACRRTRFSSGTAKYKGFCKPEELI